MPVNLNTLELLPEELERVKEEVQRIANQKWHEAGCPTDDGLACWLAAEREWIEREYVPHRDAVTRS